MGSVGGSTDRGPVSRFGGATGRPMGTVAGPGERASTTGNGQVVGSVADAGPDGDSGPGLGWGHHPRRIVSANLSVMITMIRATNGCPGWKKYEGGP